MKVSYLIYIVFCIVIISCSDETIEDPDTPYTPVITFIEPEDGAEIPNGEEIHMEVDFTFDGQTIYKVGLLLIDTDAADTVFTLEEDANAQDFYNLHDHFETSVTDTTHYTVVAYSSNEDASETVSDERHVTVIP